jgi:hypothetical protein
LYTNIRPGAYSFSVMACNNHGVWSQTPAEFSFSLAPYFWQTWWFYAVAGGVALVFGGTVQAYRLRWQRRLLKLEHSARIWRHRAGVPAEMATPPS